VLKALASASAPDRHQWDAKQPIRSRCYGAVDPLHCA
jgi:hypothetical protein